MSNLNTTVNAPESKSGADMLRAFEEDAITANELVADEQPPIETVLGKLQGVEEQRKPGEYLALCPVHEAEGNHNPSLIVTEKDDGRVLFNCRSQGCDQNRILNAVGLWWGDIEPGGYAPDADERAAEQQALVESRQTAAEHARAAWNKAKPADAEHGYLVAKGIQPHTARQLGDTLVVPVQDFDGAIYSVQYIGPDGSKRYTAHGRIKGHHTPVQAQDKPTRLLIAEGFATAATLAEAEPESMVVAAGSAGNLQSVATAARERWSEAEIVICGDLGAAGVKAAESAATAVHARVIFPRGEDGCDFNDMAAAEGLHAVAALLGAMGEPLATLEQMDIGWMLESEPPARRWLLNDLLPLNVVGLLAAGGGTGKSMLTIQLAVAVATGRPFLGIPVGEPGPVFMVAAEDDVGEIQRRLWRVVTQLREDGKLTPGDEWTPEDEARACYNLKVLPRVAENNRLTQLADGVVCGTGRTQAIAATVNQLSEPKLIVLDPVARFRGGEENNNEHATRFIEEAEKLREATGATVLMAHHVSKAGLAAGTEGLSVEGVRGASALLDGARWAMAMGTLKKEEASKFGIDREHAGMYVRLEAVKNNYAAPWPGLWLRRLPGGGVMAPTELREKDQSEAAAERRCELTDKIKDFLLEKEGKGKRLTTNGLVNFHGKDGPLAAGKERIRQAANQAVEEGVLIREDDGSLSVAGGF